MAGYALVLFFIYCRFFFEADLKPSGRHCSRSRSVVKSKPVKASDGDDVYA